MSDKNRFKGTVVGQYKTYNKYIHAKKDKNWVYNRVMDRLELKHSLFHYNTWLLRDTEEAIHLITAFNMYARLTRKTKHTTFWYGFAVRAKEILIDINSIDDMALDLADLCFRDEKMVDKGYWYTEDNAINLVNDKFCYPNGPAVQELDELEKMFPFYRRSIAGRVFEMPKPIKDAVEYFKVRQSTLFLELAAEGISRTGNHTDRGVIRDAKFVSVQAAAFHTATYVKRKYPTNPDMEILLLCLKNVVGNDACRKHNMKEYVVHEWMYTFARIPAVNVYDYLKWAYDEYRMLNGEISVGIDNLSRYLADADWLEVSLKCYFH